jgi:hypothetical protein
VATDCGPASELGAQESEVLLDKEFNLEFSGEIALVHRP